jgi:integrase
MTLSVAKIRKLQPKDKKFMASDGHGLRLLVQPGGTKTWIWRYNLAGRVGEVKLGRYPQMCIADARRRCTVLAAAILDGVSPAQQSKKEKLARQRVETVQMFAEKWVTTHVARRRKDIAPLRRYLDRDIYPVIGNRAIASIHVDDVRELIFKRVDAGHPQAARAIRNILKRLWDYAIARGVADKNPADAIPAKFVAPLSERNRALKPAELTIFLKALDAARIRPDLRTAVLFILLTLTRKGEAQNACWQEFDLDRAEWSLPEAHAKTDAPLIIPLSRQVVELLRAQRERHPRSTVVFPARNADHTPISESTLNRALSHIPMNIEHYSIHDLRRTAATNLSEKEYPQDVIEKALNHKLKGVRGIYNRAQYSKQRGEMLQFWADWIDDLRRA